MGWLELLPLLKRVLPLLDRLTPMLEMTVANRMAARSEGDRSGAAAVLAETQDALVHSVEEQRTQLVGLTQEVKLLRVANDIVVARLQTSEAQSEALAKWVKAAAVVTTLLVLIVLALVLVLLAKHA